jgi:hypothetical protein
MKKFCIFLLSVILTITSSCHYIFDKRVRGDGNVTTMTRNVTGFHSVQASGAIDVVVTQGPEAVSIETDQNLMEFIEVENRGGTLTVRERRGYNLRPSRGLKVHVTAPSFKKVALSGAGNILSGAPINNAEAIDLRVSGAGDIKMDVTAPRIASRVSGSGNIVLKGSAKISRQISAAQAKPVVTI